MAWQWESGRLPHQIDFQSLQESEKKTFNPLSFIPIPLTTLAYAGVNVINALRKSRLLFSAASLYTLPGILLTDVSLTLALAYYEFMKANQNAKEFALVLSKELHLLRMKHGKLRIVAHSLGAKHLIGMLHLYF